MPRSPRILVLHGPNLNLLGEREPSIYGHHSLSDINALLKKEAKKKNSQLKIFQSNHEGVLIDLIHEYRKWADAIIINPAAYTHTSVALLDALLAVKVPTIEVHLSDLKKREKFRQKSLTSAACIAQVSGLGHMSYVLALHRLVDLLKGARRGRK